MQRSDLDHSMMDYTEFLFAVFWYRKIQHSDLTVDLITYLWTQNFKDVQWKGLNLLTITTIAKNNRENVEW